MGTQLFCRTSSARPATIELYCVFTQTIWDSLGPFICIVMTATTPDFFAKHEFLIRRLHSLSGLIPVGAFMTVHLVVNASLLNGAATFQKNVNQIHDLGKILPLVEWLFIFLPIIFHAVIGVWIIRTGKSNYDHYRYVANWRYTLQRWSGVVAIVFIFFHVLHLHGWFHAEWWLSYVSEYGMAQFRPYSAASTLKSAMGGFLWPIFYFLGILACVFHLANGIWTMGITWGVWVSPKAQQKATYVCAAFGGVLLLVGMSALFATKQIDVEEARDIEDKMYESRVASGEIMPNPEKRFEPIEADEDSSSDPEGQGESEDEVRAAEALQAADGDWQSDSQAMKSNSPQSHNSQSNSPKGGGNASLTPKS
jgi:succinate dehydrogenase / fumarate reductase cytochrome b subunit